MPIFGSTEPGADVFHKCPECGEDKIYSKTEGIFSKTEYICDSCGHKPAKSEIRKSFSELHEENKNESTELFGIELDGPSEKLDKITDTELRQEVKDRQQEGWEVEQITDSGEKVIMTTTEGGSIGGHALTGVLTGLWTFGAGNVAYNKLSKKKNKERIVLRPDADQASTDNNEDPIELIRELKELNEEGVITDSEFEKKKEKILNEI
ncbi:hypothetical protein [Halorubrum halophilum]|uniref:hypothetical protein n=1 Tax=Halorubrum halophilum TaxID=413816 RepID=UPI0012ABC927|nr:hypothetical protein [Halorubrum halophilum]